MFAKEKGTCTCAVKSHFIQPCLHHSGKLDISGFWLPAYKFGPKALQGNFVEQSL
jgi:hypothetical protein